MEATQPLTANLSLWGTLAVSLVGFALSVMLLWWAALIVHVRDIKITQALLGSLGISFTVLGFFTALQYIPEGAQSHFFILLGAMILLQVMVLKWCFRTSVVKAAGIWLLDIVMILIVYSLFLVAVTGQAPSSR
ncbi:MAG: hypothetical protein R6V19_06705 [Armatimonadota bacterium]